MDTLRSMELLVLAVNGGSLSSAGRQLHMSPAAVTRHISALEDRLGVRLLNRSSRALTLTEAGNEYYANARRLLQEISSVESRTRELGSSPTGTVRIHARPLIGSQLITPAMPDLLKAHPGINLSLMMSNADLNLADHNLDVDIRAGRPEDSSFAMRKLGETQRVLVAAPGYLAEAPPLEVPEDLEAHDCLAYTTFNQSALWSVIDAAGTKMDISVSGRFQCDFGTAVRDMALAGAGVALLPEWAVSADVQAGRLVRCLPDCRVSHVDFDNGIYAVFLRGRHIAAKTRLVVDFLADVFRRKSGME